MIERSFEEKKESFENRLPQSFTSELVLKQKISCIKRMCAFVILHQLINT